MVGPWGEVYLHPGSALPFTTRMESVNETQFQSEVISLAEDLGHLIFHSTDSRRDIGPGFPDLVIVGRHRTIFAELKSASGDLFTEQVQWKYRLIATGMYWVLWRPKDLENGYVEAVLRELLQPHRGQCQQWHRLHGASEQPLAMRIPRKVGVDLLEISVDLLQQIQDQLLIIEHLLPAPDAVIVLM